MMAALALTSACTGSPVESTASDSASSTTDGATESATEGSSTMTTSSGNSASGTTNGGSMSASASGSTTSSSESETATMSGTTVDPTATTTNSTTTTTDTTVGTEPTTDATTEMTGVVDTSDGTTGDMTTGDMTTGDMTTGDMTTGDMTTGDPPECGTSLKVTIRDFQIAHPDFQSYCCGLVTGLVKPDLGMNNKPVFNQAGNPKMLTDEATFNQWYNDVNGVNQSTTIFLDLMEIQPGLYSYNSNSFFPIDNMLFGNEGNNHNFHFTTCRLLV